MTTFYIVRHGQSELNTQHRLQGHIDSPLTEKGVKDAALVAKKLKKMQFDKIYSSDLGRAFRTAYLIAKDLGFSDEIETNSGLREINYGDFAFQKFPYVFSKYPQSCSRVFPELLTFNIS